MASGRFVGTNELHQNSKVLLSDITASGETFYITEDGKAKAVLMDISRYNALMDLVEEAESPKASGPGDDTRKHASVRGFLSRNTARKRRR